MFKFNEVKMISEDECVDCWSRNTLLRPALEPGCSLTYSWTGGESSLIPSLSASVCYPFLPLLSFNSYFLPSLLLFLTIIPPPPPFLKLGFLSFPQFLFS